MASSTSTLAEGAFGKIYKQKYNGQWAAVKKVPTNALSRKDLEREYKVYKEAIHPNIVKILGPIKIEDNKYVIPLEFIFGEDLETSIFERRKSKIELSPAVVHTIIVGMCEGLYYLHSKDIVHQDLKPDNIMVEHGSNKAVIVDLGLAKFYKNGLNSAADWGNIAYSAPEVLLRICQRSQRSDVWAMGKIIAELHLLRRLKTKEVHPSTVRQSLRRSPYRRVVCAMVQPEPADRATMAAVVRDPALTFVDADDDHPEGVGMSCGHMVIPAALTRWCRRQLKDGKSRLQCGLCDTKWSLSEVTTVALFTDEQKSFVEAILNENHAINDLRAKCCPGCKSYILRKTPENLCVRCPQCTADGKAHYDFCWQCLKKWKGPAPRLDHCENEGCVDLNRE